MHGAGDYNRQSTRLPSPGAPCGDDAALLAGRAEAEQLRQEIRELQARRARQRQQQAARAVRLRSEHQSKLDKALADVRRGSDEASARSREAQETAKRHLAQAKRLRAQAVARDDARRLVDADRGKLQELAASLRREEAEAMAATARVRESHAESVAAIVTSKAETMEMTKVVEALYPRLLAASQALQRTGVPPEWRSRVEHEREEVREAALELQAAQFGESQGSDILKAIQHDAREMASELEERRSTEAAMMSVLMRRTSELKQELWEKREEVASEEAKIPRLIAEFADESERLEAEAVKAAQALSERYSDREQDAEAQTALRSQRLAEECAAWSKKVCRLQSEMEEAGEALTSTGLQRKAMERAVASAGDLHSRAEACFTSTRETKARLERKQSSLARQLEAALRKERQQAARAAGLHAARRVEIEELAAQAGERQRLELEELANLQNIEDSEQQAEKESALDAVDLQESLAIEEQGMLERLEDRVDVRCGEAVKRSQAAISELLRDFEEKAARLTQEQLVEESQTMAAERRLLHRCHLAPPSLAGNSTLPKAEKPASQKLVRDDEDNADNTSVGEQRGAVGGGEGTEDSHVCLESGSEEEDEDPGPDEVVPVRLRFDQVEAGSSAVPT
eukprot:TRINITY_DN17516_c0_g3_i1.p1 TRINITY_DN17516_c0_g3~~TRINITY_DN17516_c0_g3_i1.p1  ORF type:complete len:631 (-),score=218.96 TRINITY_DN17516_c0_g3_i1:97-1989(-)